MSWSWKPYREVTFHNHWQVEMGELATYNPLVRRIDRFLRCEYFWEQSVKVACLVGCGETIRWLRLSSCVSRIRAEKYAIFCETKKCFVNAIFGVYYSDNSSNKQLVFAGKYGVFLLGRGSPSGREGLLHFISCDLTSCYVILQSTCPHHLSAVPIASHGKTYAKCFGATRSTIQLWGSRRSSRVWTCWQVWIFDHFLNLTVLCPT